MSNAFPKLSIILLNLLVQAINLSPGHKFGKTSMPMNYEQELMALRYHLWFGTDDACENSAADAVNTFGLVVDIIWRNPRDASFCRVCSLVRGNGKCREDLSILGGEIAPLAAKRIGSPVTLMGHPEISSRSCIVLCRDKVCEYRVSNLVCAVRSLWSLLDVCKAGQGDLQGRPACWGRRFSNRLPPKSREHRRMSGRWPQWRSLGALWRVRPRRRACRP
jgi:hypothetical protein